MSEAKIVLSVRVEKELVERLDELVERTGVSRGEIVERCLRAGVNDQEQFAADLESAWKGPLMQLLMRPKMLKIIGGLREDEIDPVQQKFAKGFSERKRRAKGRPAVD